MKFITNNLEIVFLNWLLNHTFKPIPSLASNHSLILNQTFCYNTFMNKKFWPFRTKSMEKLNTGSYLYYHFTTRFLFFCNIKSSTLAKLWLLKATMNIFKLVVGMHFNLAKLYLDARLSSTTVCFSSNPFFNGGCYAAEVG